MPRAGVPCGRLEDHSGKHKRTDDPTRSHRGREEDPEQRRKYNREWYLRWRKADPAGAREQERERSRRLRKTPGTYQYNAAHGIGISGEKKRFRARRSHRKQATERDLQTLKELFNGTT
jgi:hypothetical protein